MARLVPPGFDIVAFSRAFDGGYAALQAAENHLDKCGFLFDQPSGWSLFGGGPPGRRAPRAASGDGHVAPSVDTKETSEDLSFKFALSWLSGANDKGWAFHYRPQNPPVSAEIEGVFKFLSLKSFNDCPEFDFEPCYWRFFAYQQRGDSIFDSNADYVYRSFRAHAEHFSLGVEKLLEAHASLEPFGMTLLPTLDRPAVRLEANLRQRLGRPAGAADTREFDFDVAISFAGPERPQAEELASLLREAGTAVFYDNYYAEDLWGKDLVVHFDEIYRKRSRFCVMFISQAYAERMWTNHERKSAQARALEEKGREYILPINVDGTELPGLPPTVGHVDIKLGMEKIATLLVKKLRR